MPRILVVDDDRTTLNLIRLQLRSAGYTVDTAPDGAAGLERLQQRRYDLVLLDVWMPGMDGLEVLGRIRDVPQPPPVVVMTADDAPATVAERDPRAGVPLRHETDRARGPAHARRRGARGAPGGSPDRGRLRPPGLGRAVVPCDRRSAERIQEFVMRLESDLPADVRASVGQAFRELLMNAIEWGGGLDPRQTVRIACLRAKRMLLFRIADPGKGFSFANLPHAAVSNAPDVAARARARARGEGPAARAASAC